MIAKKMEIARSPKSPVLKTRTVNTIYIAQGKAHASELDKLIRVY